MCRGGRTRKSPLFPRSPSSFLSLEPRFLNYWRYTNMVLILDYSNISQLRFAETSLIKYIKIWLKYEVKVQKSGQKSRERETTRLKLMSVSNIIVIFIIVLFYIGTYFYPPPRLPLLRENAWDSYSYRSTAYFMDVKAKCHYTVARIDVVPVLSP